MQAVAAIGRADRALVDQLAGGLETAAKEGIRSTADQDTLFRSEGEQFTPLLAGRGQRLLVVDGFPGGDRLHRDIGVGERDREVHHQLDIGVGQQVIHGHRRDTVLRGACFGPARRACRRSP